MKKIYLQTVKKVDHIPFRTDFQDLYLFENLVQIRNYAEIWMWKYNNERPHSSLHISRQGTFC